MTEQKFIIVFTVNFCQKALQRKYWKIEREREGVGGGERDLDEQEVYMGVTTSLGVEDCCQTNQKLQVPVIINIQVCYLIIDNYRPFCSFLS